MSGDAPRLQKTLPQVDSSGQQLILIGTNADRICVFGSSKVDDAGPTKFGEWETHPRMNPNHERMWKSWCAKRSAQGRGSGSGYDPYLYGPAGLSERKPEPLDLQKRLQAMAQICHSRNVFGISSVPLDIGEYFAFGSGCDVELWSVNAQRCVERHIGHHGSCNENVYGVVPMFDPKSQLLFSGAFDGSIRARSRWVPGSDSDISDDSERIFSRKSTVLPVKDDEAYIPQVSFTNLSICRTSSGRSLLFAGGIGAYCWTDVMRTLEGATGLKEPSAKAKVKYDPHLGMPDIRRLTKVSRLDSSLCKPSSRVTEMQSPSLLDVFPKVQSLWPQKGSISAISDDWCTEARSEDHLVTFESNVDDPGMLFSAAWSVCMDDDPSMPSHTVAPRDHVSVRHAMGDREFAEEVMRIKIPEHLRTVGDPGATPINVSQIGAISMCWEPVCKTLLVGFLGGVMGFDIRMPTSGPVLRNLFGGISRVSRCDDSKFIVTSVSLDKLDADGEFSALSFFDFKGKQLFVSKEPEGMKKCGYPVSALIPWGRLPDDLAYVPACAHTLGDGNGGRFEAVGRPGEEVAAILQFMYSVAERTSSSGLLQVATTGQSLKLFGSLLLN